MRWPLCRWVRRLFWISALFLSLNAEAVTIVISGNDVNVRSGPGRTYDIIAIVHQDEKFGVLEEQDGWYKISVEGQIGWISVKGTSGHADESVEDLLTLADRYFRQRQFTTPADANAFDLYQEVLRQDPDNSHARRQIDEMARIYKSWAEVAAQRGDEKTARIYYERYAFVAPEEVELPQNFSSSSASVDSSESMALQIYKLRADPAEISAETLRRMIRQYHFNHPADWSKHDLSASITGTIRHDYERLVTPQGVTVVADYATNLMWQHSSPPTPMTWNDAHTYIQQLNAMRYGGYADWRLPTLEELASLLEPMKSPKNLYLDPGFGTTQLWCWSADPVASSQEDVWYVSFSSGGIQPHQIEASAFVLAVRTLQ